MDSLGIYISIPFCRSKCTYCNFASDVYSAALHRQYVARLCADVGSARRRAAQWGAEIPRQVDSVYLGGGTPSLLASELLRQLWHALRQEFDIAKTAEITLECAPGQLDEAALETMLECGLNRISFGVQSFVDREAAVTGRLHTREISLAGLKRVRSAGVERVNIDLIAGLPHQTSGSWRESLETLAASGVDHASVYMLEVDEDSRLGRELLAGGSRYHAETVPSDDLTADFYEMAIAALDEHGLRQYEISNFARPGSESRHNEKYWRRQPYLGFGLDAHSHLRRPGATSLRFETGAVLEQYLVPPQLVVPGQTSRGGKPPLSVRELSLEEEVEEAWFLGLRLSEGVQWSTLVKQFGEERLECYLPIAGELCELELLVNQEGNFRLTRRGILFSNEVFARFLGVRQTQSIAV